MQSFKQFAHDEYAPYDTFPEFWEGVSDCGMRSTRGYDDVRGQAYDRGLEAAMRYLRQNGGLTGP